MEVTTKDGHKKLVIGKPSKEELKALENDSVPGPSEGLLGAPKASAPKAEEPKKTKK